VRVMFIPISLGGMTSGTPCQRREREGEGTVSGGEGNGPCATFDRGLDSSPGPFNIFPIFFLFSFLFSFVKISNSTKMI
jgi:hypothetical protein